MTKKLSLIFPAYNEAARLPRCLETAVEYFRVQPWDTEIIVIENGSTDNTYSLALELMLEAARQPYHNLTYKVNRSQPGKGFACREGVKVATGDFILISDVDLSTPLSEVYKLLAAHNDTQADFIIGSRRAPGGLVLGRSWDRKLAGWLFSGLVRTLAPGIKDTQCGFKLITSQAANKIRPLMTIGGFSFDVEMIYLARRLGYSVKEIPVNWVHDYDSKVRPITDGANMALEIITIWHNILNGSYKA